MHGATCSAVPAALARSAERLAAECAFAQGLRAWLSAQLQPLRSLISHYESGPWCLAFVPSWVRTMHLLAHAAAGTRSTQHMQPLSTCSCW